MRTIIIERNIFKFAELSEDAQEKAINWFREQGYDFYGDNRETLNKFCDTFPIVADSWEYNECRCNGYINSTFIGEDDEGLLKGLRLRTYILNNYWYTLYQPAKYYIRQFQDDQKKRTSKIMYQETCCPFTGVWIDEEILDPIRKFIAKPDLNMDYETLLHKCLESWVNACQKDIEYQMSDGAIKEQIEANDYEFTEDGELY